MANSPGTVTDSPQDVRRRRDGSRMSSARFGKRRKKSGGRKDDRSAAARCGRQRLCDAGARTGQHRKIEVRPAHPQMVERISPGTASEDRVAVLLLAGCDVGGGTVEGLRGRCGQIGRSHRAIPEPKTCRSTGSHGGRTQEARMSYREENEQVILSMSKEDYETVLAALASFTVLHLARPCHTERICALMNEARAASTVS